MKQWISNSILCVLIPTAILCGSFLFREKAYAWISLCVAVLACISLFLRFERRTSKTKELLLIAVMTALSAVGRFVFAPLPGFKPVTAFVVLTALYFGGEAGFITGALSAVVSDIYFGQGPWTPFQMFAWGFIGLAAGWLAQPLRAHRLWLLLYGAFSGVLFSLLMDVWTVLWQDGTLNVSRYLAALVTALPFMAVYAVSNVVFLLLLARPVGKILDRLKTKYAL